MRVEENKSLKNLNTFGIACNARYFVSVKTITELKQALSQKPSEELFILGGGSNMLLTGNLDAFVLHINLKGIEILKETEAEVFVKAMAGENWHEFVKYCIEKGFGGLENLSLIPGNVGTAPIQNIGAYGVELKDTFVSCNTVEIQTLKEREFTKDECAFEYRNSIFKNEAKGNYIITSVTFRLTKRDHKTSVSYGDIKKVLSEKNIETPTIKDISEAVITIRQSKLPDPKVLGNSGSFFKNPVVDSETFQEFRRNFPEAPFYEVSPTAFKIPAGWLIEKAGFKGQRFGDAGVHKNQALVLVNYGKASGKEIWQLAMDIQKKVKELTGIFIEAEVNVF
ncbi:MULTISPECIES: UDP-N-acetylmuramate dehydrogenase [Aequorivita]|uniref:UDP-N-acetylenolpyruvoylglucosamine reductase n=1 Tax=Aequorivita iocasae TaxID=2803865 RepID=A0ABX7DVG7_9FLAO|nr:MULTISPECIES: UDP-N-acetylmuramate dehydrogenase [Aequorivita]QQX78140.1 UDP-N-acetylmuramate dehydrogenase [Aequorivita iocasae]UCA57686.1 UDP-N-acetylmuramate dehydrogenase [Aequorivita sp. F7]